MVQQQPPEAQHHPAPVIIQGRKLRERTHTSVYNNNKLDWSHNETEAPEDLLSHGVLVGHHQDW